MTFLKNHKIKNKNTNNTTYKKRGIWGQREISIREVSTYFAFCYAFSTFLTFSKKDALLDTLSRAFGLDI